jgi:simple sugar transport system ATP-binding protein
MLGTRNEGTASVNSRRSLGSTAVVANRITVTDARGIPRIRDASFEIRSGEIVGIAAVEGSGHHELLRAIAGRLPTSSGTLRLPPVVGFVPDDRHREGLILDMTLIENFALKGLGARRGLVRWREAAATTRQIMREFDVRAENEGVLARTLSGGNQQKFILGRELHDFPPLLVAANPTRGLDIRASAYVEQRLVAAALNGAAVIVHSADLDEILSIANRVLVVYSGTVREVAANREDVGRAMLGAA